MGNIPDNPTGPTNYGEFEKFEKEREVDPKTGLFAHARNCFIDLGQFCKNISNEKFRNLLFKAVVAKPLLHYEETITHVGVEEEQARKILQNSDPEQVRKFNEIVDDFNKNLEWIKAGQSEKSYSKIQEVWEKADALFKQV